MVLDPIPQPLPVHFFGSRPQPPTSLRWRNLAPVGEKNKNESEVEKRFFLCALSHFAPILPHLPVFSGEYMMVLVVCHIYVSAPMLLPPSFYLTRRGGGLGSRPKQMYGERLGDGVEYHLMSPTPRR